MIFKMRTASSRPLTPLNAADAGVCRQKTVHRTRVANDACRYRGDREKADPLASPDCDRLCSQVRDYRCWMRVHANASANDFERHAIRSLGIVGAACCTCSTDAHSSPALQCRKCQGSGSSIQYGKFGYYFKCRGCDGNTPIKFDCGKEGHKERSACARTG